MSITNLTIPYPDFKLAEIIDPEQFDINNNDMVVKTNAIIAVLNQLTDSIADGGSGADAISLTSIAPFVSTKLQAFLEEVVNRLKSTTDGVSGADFIASTSITGVTGATVQAQLVSLKGLIDGLRTDVTALQGRATALESRATNVEGRATNVEGRATALELRVTNNESGLANRYMKTETYSQAEVNTRLALASNAVVDGGSFLDTYTTKIAPIDGGGF